MTAALYLDQDALARATDVCVERDIRIFATHRYGDLDGQHVQSLLSWMNPPQGASILDAGCGVGEVAHIMAMIRPDLHFTLLNNSEHQLAMCPDGPRERPLLGDFHNIPAPDASFDVVMFNTSICHADVLRAMKEAFRVLRPGGTLFISDVVRTGGDNALMERVLGSRAYAKADIEAWARVAGFKATMAISPRGDTSTLKALFSNDDLFNALYAEIAPAIFRFERMPDMSEIESAFARHDRIGFQFSGGRDSLCALYLLEPYWGRMTVYHLDTGDQFPETQKLVRRVEADVPNFVRIHGRLHETIATFGLPTDILPTRTTPIGRMVTGSQVKLQDRFDCCARSVMAPMHERIQADGITLIIRGQRNSDYATKPLRSGDFSGGMEVLYPIETWTDEQVMLSLNQYGIQPAPFYEHGLSTTPECMTCSAWWDDGRAAYLKRFHPKAHAEYQQRLQVIKAEIAPHIRELNAEIEAGKAQ